jgi:hypothetical protein
VISTATLPQSHQAPIAESIGVAIQNDSAVDKNSLHLLLFACIRKCFGLHLP